MPTKATSKARDDDAPEADDKETMRTGRTSWQEDDERKDRERLRKEHAEVTPEKLSELMTEKSILKTDYAARRKKEDEEHQQKIFELDIQIARGQANNPGRTV